MRAGTARIEIAPSAIETVEYLTIYENPIPNLVSRHAYFPGLVKLPSGLCIELRNGDLSATGPPFPMWDNTLPSGRQGIVLQSWDKGKTWDDQTAFYKSSEGNISPYETRSCEM